MFWPGEFHGLYSAWGGKESDRTERLSLVRFHYKDTCVHTGTLAHMHAHTCVVSYPHVLWMGHRARGHSPGRWTSVPLNLHQWEPHMQASLSPPPLYLTQKTAIMQATAQIMFWVFSVPTEFTVVRFFSSSHRRPLFLGPLGLPILVLFHFQCVV